MPHFFCAQLIKSSNCWCSNSKCGFYPSGWSKFGLCTQNDDRMAILTPTSIRWQPASQSIRLSFVGLQMKQKLSLYDISILAFFCSIKHSFIRTLLQMERTGVQVTGWFLLIRKYHYNYKYSNYNLTTYDAENIHTNSQIWESHSTNKIYKTAKQKPKQSKNSQY